MVISDLQCLDHGKSTTHLLTQRDNVLLSALLRRHRGSFSRQIINRQSGSTQFGEILYGVSSRISQHSMCPASRLRLGILRPSLGRRPTEEHLFWGSEAVPHGTQCVGVHRHA